MPAATEFESLGDCWHFLIRSFLLFYCVLSCILYSRIFRNCFRNTSERASTRIIVSFLSSLRSSLMVHLNAVLFLNFWKSTADFQCKIHSWSVVTCTWRTYENFIPISKYPVFLPLLRLNAYRCKCSSYIRSHISVIFESLFDCVSLSFIHLCHIRFPLFLWIPCTVPTSSVTFLNVRKIPYKYIETHILRKL